MNCRLIGFITAAALICAPLSLALSQEAAQAITPSQPIEQPTPKVRRNVPDTLMFSIDELNEIKDRIAGGETTKDGQLQDIETATLYLSSIMYSGPKDWTVWINGAPIGPNQDFQAFQVTDINPRFVELLVPLSVQGMRPVRLEPNQTFITASGIIVEGKYP